MSAEALPITPARFAEALKDLSLSSLHLKVLELRNSIAHLDYSNEQLRPFAEGTATALGATPSEPDPDCIEAIRENKEVIEKMQERIRLVRAEVEQRGSSWTEFESKEEAEAKAAVGQDAPAQANGVNGHTEDAPRAGEQSHSAWTDGTFQTGVIRGDQLVMDSVARSRSNPSTTGGSLTDEELRRRMEEQLRDLENDDDDEGGMHL
ncbi:hypothetical protein OQA88_1511 [Cercophora sp. LCS_1]